MSNNFFSKENSTALRGLWLIPIFMVHVPMQFQNRIQDALGSFAFVGVTFFFLVSGYGLVKSYGDGGKLSWNFWTKRLPKLLIPVWAINIFSFLSFYLIGIPTGSLIEVLRIDLWVCWLLLCYLIFWIVRALYSGTGWKLICCLLLMVVGGVMYYLQHCGIYQNLTWAVEAYGFIWGIILASIEQDFVRWCNSKWLVKVLLSCVLAGALGVLYLKFKTVFFVGDYLLKILLGLSIMVFMLICDVKYVFSSRIFAALGGFSLEFYLIHGNIFDILKKVFANGVSSWIAILIGFVISVVAAWVVNRICRIFYKYYYRLVK
nr:acyltransferase family protein [uncultured Butyrivibrio sp.]